MGYLYPSEKIGLRKTHIPINRILKIKIGVDIANHN